MTRPAGHLLDTILVPESVHRTTLANGLRVLIRRETSAPVVAIVTYVKAGYFDETDDVVGIAHVLEHMYFKGTPSRGVGQIARETKASGGYLNAGTIYDNTHYYTVLPHRWQRRSVPQRQAGRAQRMTSHRSAGCRPRSDRRLPTVT